MGEDIVFVVEHLEPRLSTWMLLEYRHVSMIVGAGRAVFTNVSRPEWRRLLSPLGRIYGETVARVFAGKRLLVLDPAADRLLEPGDYDEVDAVVVGGIMGDHPPRGRTWSLLTARLRNPVIRSLGDRQLSIDGAVYVAYRVWRGARLDEIPLVEGVELELEPLPGIRRTIRLPFAYPLVGGRPLLAPGLEEHLRRTILYEEHLFLQGA
ncbi:MAG: SAM-dependent methyltransferase [Candidatus Korarchaeota archaeon]|nr:SAM-dependent methyltransferase [Candidatus Korarchaeota archaeon]